MLAEETGLGAKRRARRTQPGETRPDWDDVKVEIMAECLWLKAAQHPMKFATRLARTGDQPLVEESPRDDFWGAIPVDDEVLEGQNILGLLLMDLRSQLSL